MEKEVNEPQAICRSFRMTLIINFRAMELVHFIGTTDLNVYLKS